MQSTPAPHPNEEYTLPCAEALLAGTMALIAGNVQACCGAHREAMAGKIVSNLTALAEGVAVSSAVEALLHGHTPAARHGQRSAYHALCACCARVATQQALAAGVIETSA